jgi:hypothetical protein
MSFNGVINVVNIVTQHKQIANEFVRYYYGNLSNNLGSVAPSYFADSFLTILEVEGIGFGHYLQQMQLIGVQRLGYHIFNIFSQPITNDMLLIVVFGKLTANGINYEAFSETFTLVKDSQNGFHIRNQILQLCPKN